MPYSLDKMWNWHLGIFLLLNTSQLSWKYVGFNSFFSVVTLSRCVEWHQIRESWSKWIDGLLCTRKNGFFSPWPTEGYVLVWNMWKGFHSMLGLKKMRISLLIKLGRLLKSGSCAPLYMLKSDQYCMKRLLGKLIQYLIWG